MRILILSSSDGIALTLMRCIGLGAQQPIECFLFSIWPSQGFANRSRYCKGAAIAEMTDFSKPTVDCMVELINEHAERYKIDVIVPAGLWGTYFLALFQGRLGVKVFPVPAAKAFRQLNDKGRFSELMQTLNVPTPLTASLEAMDPDCQRWSYPLVIKPTCAGNSMGIRILSAPEDFLTYRERMDSRHRFILQEYIEGIDFVFGFIAEHGALKAWTLHRKGAGKLHFTADESVLKMAQKVIGVTGYHGVGNFDVRWDQRRQKFLLIECNPRFWGSVGISRYFGTDFLAMGFAMLHQPSCPLTPALGVNHTIVLPYPNPIRHLCGYSMDRQYLQPGYLPSFAWRELIDPWPTLIERWLRFLKVMAVDDNVMIDAEEDPSCCSDVLSPCVGNGVEPLQIPFIEDVT